MAGFGCRVDLQRDRGEGAAVTQAELFFDLVFVFVVTQLSHLLLSHLTGSGAVDTLVLFCATWWAWIYTGWTTNWLDPERRPVRAMLFAMMAAGLVMAAALPRAFGARGMVFALSYCAIQLGRCGFMLWALRAHNAAVYRNFQRLLAWSAAGAAAWIAGALLPGVERLAVWAGAVALEGLGPAFGFWTPGLGRSLTADWQVDGRHVAERCSAFVLIALGESLTVTGAAFFESHWTGPVALAFACAFVGSVALWWIYFDTAAQRTTDKMAEVDDPGRLARAAYTYLHAVLVAGVIAWAVACQQLLIAPARPIDPATLAVLVGGPGLYLLGNGVFRRTLSPRFSPSHRLGLACLAVIGLQGMLRGGSKLVLGVETAGALALTGAVGSLLYHRQERRRLSGAYTQP